MLEGEQGLSFHPGELSEQDVTPPVSRGTVDPSIDAVPVNGDEVSEKATVCDSTSTPAAADAADTPENERSLVESTDQGAEGVTEQPDSLLCMSAAPISPPCPHVMEWATVQAIVRNRLGTYDPAEIDAALGNIQIDRNRMASGTISDATFSDVVAAVYKGASDLETANEFAMLMSGAVDLDPAAGLAPDLRNHIKNLSLYGRIAGATVPWVLQQIESDDVSEVIGMHPTRALHTDV